jgi:hypothetical protein
MLAFGGGLPCVFDAVTWKNGRATSIAYPSREAFDISAAPFSVVVAPVMV